MRLTSYLIAPLFVLWIPACAGSCGKNAGNAAPAPTGSTAAATSSAEPGDASSPRPGERPDDEVRPVYPVTNDPPNPLAARLCDALHTRPAARKAECCASSPGFTTEAECARMLSFALKEKAVTLDPADVDRCAEATARSLEGCDWVTPQMPDAPAACDGIIHGTYKEGDRCRSSLECVDGLRCLGGGPTDAGRCGKPLPRGSLCNTAVDPLAAYTRQVSFEERHPECAGFCARRWCGDRAPVGGACNASVECGPNRYCIDKKCAEGPLPAAGEPCRSGLCAKGARCAKGKCVAPGGEGEPCEANTDCRGACQKPTGSKTGSCVKKCWAF